MFHWKLICAGLALAAIGQVSCEEQSNVTSLTNSSLGDLPHLDNIPASFGLEIDALGPGGLSDNEFWTSAMRFGVITIRTSQQPLTRDIRFRWNGIELRIEAPETPLLYIQVLWTLQLLAQQRFHRAHTGSGISGHLIDKSDPGNVVRIAEFYYQRIPDTASSSSTFARAGGMKMNDTNEEPTWTWRNIRDVSINPANACYTVISLFAVIYTTPEPFQNRWDYFNPETHCRWSYVPTDPARSTFVWLRGVMFESVVKFLEHWNGERYDRMPRAKNTIADLTDPDENFKGTLLFLGRPDSDPAT